MESEAYPNLEIGDTLNLCRYLPFFHQPETNQEVLKMVTTRKQLLSCAETKVYFLSTESQRLDRCWTTKTLRLLWVQNLKLHYFLEIKKDD